MFDVPDAERNTSVSLRYQERAHTRTFGTSSGDVLGYVRGRDEDLGERDGVVGKEEERQVLVGVGVDVDVLRHVHDEANRLIS